MKDITHEDIIKVFELGINIGSASILEQVLDIVDEIDDYTCIKFGPTTYSGGKDELRKRILALGGEQK